MMNESSVLTKKHTVVQTKTIERTKTEPHKRLECKLNELVDTFSINAPMNLKGSLMIYPNWSIAVLNFEARKSVIFVKLMKQYFYFFYTRPLGRARRD